MTDKPALEDLSDAKETVIILDFGRKTAHIDTVVPTVKNKLIRSGIKVLAFNGLNGKPRRWVTDLPLARLAWRIKKGKQ